MKAKELEMPTEVLVELIKTIPTLLWIIFSLIVLRIFYKPIRKELIPRLSGFKAFGVEATFIKDQLAQATKEEITEEVLDQVARRAQRLREIVTGAQLLIVNDVPDEMVHVRNILASLGVSVSIARTTKQAISMMKKTRFDVVISDMSRNGVNDEGLRFLDETLRLQLHRPTIFTVGRFDPSKGVPAYAFGITNRVDELLNLIFDVLERERG